MARQQVVVAAFLLLTTVGLAFGADAPTPSAGGAFTTPKRGLPTFSGVPAPEPVAADNNEVGTVGGADGAAAPSPGGSVDTVAAGAVGGPVSESTFGSIDRGNAEGPKPSAATAGQLSARVAVAAAAVAATSFFF